MKALPDGYEAGEEGLVNIKPMKPEPRKKDQNRITYPFL
jgi:hypothetical protein